MNKIHQGYRFFRCDECGCDFIETCRDHESPSGSTCPDGNLTHHEHNFVSPYNSCPDPNIEVDRFGNLTNGTQVWIKK